jgi:hypothetical protein
MKSVKRIKLLQPLPLLIFFSIVTIFIVLSTLSAAVIVIIKQNAVRDKTILSNLIIDSVENLNKPIPSDPKTGEVFLRNMKLQMPAPELALGPIVYRYEINEGSEVIGRVNIAAQQDINEAKSRLRAATDLKSSFNEVPRLQACAYGVLIAFTPTEGEYTLVQEKQLKNGKKAYIYTEEKCRNNALIEYTKKIESY